MQSQNLRKERGRLICEKGTEVKRIDEHTYEVNSQSGNGVYQIISTEYGWACSCPDNQYKDVDCKHIFAVRFSQAIRKEVEAKSQKIIRPISDVACIFCGSENISKDGVRHNKAGDIQKFECKMCGRYFTINIGFERMKHNPKGITMAMQLYFSGESSRKTAKSLQLLGVKVSHRTVLNWIDKYCSLMEKYLDKIVPQVSSTWRADELFLKVKGDMKYLFALMDDETRFWISQQVATHKGTDDVRPLLREAKERANKLPEVFITDGAANFHDAFRKEFLDAYGENPSAVHIAHIHLAGDMNNNKIESMNGELRDREKVMRSLKNEDSSIIKGMRIFHNFVRPHMGLDGKTPAEAAGIKVEGENPWLTLIQNSSDPTKLSNLRSGVRAD